MTPEQQNQASDAGELFAGKGETESLMRSMDWSTTLLGPIGTWPTSLRTALSICLLSRFPMAVCWGSSYVILYNDAYRHILGDKHPWAMGRPTFEVWDELAHIVLPMFEGVIATGEATWFDDLTLPMLRHGYLEEAYFTLSYSAIRGESNQAAGVFVTVTETTERFLAERRLRLVRELGGAAGSVRTTAEATDRAGEILAKHPADVPFSLLYMVDASGRHARLAMATGLTRNDRVSPASLAIEDGQPEPWPIAHVLRTREPLVVEAAEALGSLPGGIWPDRPSKAVLLPIPRPPQTQPIGVLVCGVNPRRALDDRHVEFFRLVAGQIANAMANANTHEEINEQAKRSEGDLRRALALREEFLTIASHELRTPLTTLGLQAEALLRSIQEAPPGDPPIESWARKAERLRSQAIRLEQLIEGMLDVAGLGGTGFHLQLEDCDLARVVAAVVERFRGESKHAHRLLKLRAEPALGRWDPKRVDQLTSQLLSNALKFGGDKPIEISVGIVDEGARISVRDYGIGVAKEDHERIFERFERAVTSEHFGGLGVGLWIAGELVKAMGGTVRVESSPGDGATFMVKLPRNP